jgi:hypothetical protein
MLAYSSGVGPKDRTGVSLSPFLRLSVSPRPRVSVSPCLRLTPSPHLPLAGSPCLRFPVSPHLRVVPFLPDAPCPLRPRVAWQCLQPRSALPNAPCSLPRTLCLAPYAPIEPTNPTNSTGQLALPNEL